MGGVKDSNDIYYSTIKDDGTWTNAVKISSRPPNGKYLLMSLDRDDGYGERDLYVISPPESEKRRMGETEKRGRQVTDSPIHPRLPALGEGLVGGQAFTDSVSNRGAINLGSTVNTASDDISPFLAADGVSLYFSSRGFSSYGGYDIYKTIRLDDTWQNWSEPENQGPEINSGGNESCFTIPYSGDQAYFLKKRSPPLTPPRGGTGYPLPPTGGKGDGKAPPSGGLGGGIYKIKLQDALKPYIIYSISGVATNILTKEPVEAEVRLYVLIITKFMA